MVRRQREERRRQPRFSGHKHFKGDCCLLRSPLQCHRPFYSSPGNQNESPLLKEALPQVTRIAKQVGLDLNKTIVSLDGVYDSRANRSHFQSRDGTEYSRKSARQKDSQAGRQFAPPSFRNGFTPSSESSLGRISFDAYCCALKD